MDIPEDMHSNVFDLTTRIVNASWVGDTKTVWRLYNELREYCEKEALAGRNHPFLWETLADFTTDDKIAIGLYLKALEGASRAGANDYEASILLALGERYKDLGDAGEAHRYATAANEKAVPLDDLALRQSISQFLLDESRNT